MSQFLVDMYLGRLETLDMRLEILDRKLVIEHCENGSQLSVLCVCHEILAQKIKLNNK